MDCQSAREELAAGLVLADAAAWPEPVARHLAACEGCQSELAALRATWALLVQWSEASPRTELTLGLRRRVRRQVFKESVLTPGGWTPAVLAAVVGAALSLGLSLLVPYSLLVEVCGRFLELSDSHPGAFLLAGLGYGFPLALGGWILGRQAASGALIRGLEASLLFLVILAPYVIIQCRDFAPQFQIAFVSGLGGGAVVSSLAVVALTRRAAWGRFPVSHGRGVT